MDLLRNLPPFFIIPSLWVGRGRNHDVDLDRRSRNPSLCPAFASFADQRRWRRRTEAARHPSIPGQGFSSSGRRTSGSEHSSPVSALSPICFRCCQLGSFVLCKLFPVLSYGIDLFVFKQTCDPSPSLFN